MAGDEEEEEQAPPSPVPGCFTASVVPLNCFCGTSLEPNSHRTFTQWKDDTKSHKTQFTVLLHAHKHLVKKDTTGSKSHT